MPDLAVANAAASAPAAPAGRIVAAPGGRYRLWTHGRAGAPAVLLIHGLGWDARRLWTGTMRRLAEGGFHVLAPDLLGCGGSAPLAAPRPLEDVADDLAALLAAADVGRCAVVGFSMGVAVAMALAARPGSPVEAAVFACGGTGPEPAAAIEAMLARADALGPRAFAEEQAAAIWHPAYAARHPEEVAAFVDWRAAMDQRSLANQFRSLTLSDLSPALPAIRQPALVIAADADPFASVADAAALAARLPDARLERIDGCGHMAPVEQPDRFDDLVATFLRTAWAR